VLPDRLTSVLDLQRTAGNRVVSATLNAMRSGGGQPVLPGGGFPIPDSVRIPMEAAFGHDFRGVRLHTDAVAEGSAEELQASAFTVGHDIVFAPSRFNPETPDGQRLLAHELAHVVQQERGDAPPELDPHASHEQDATQAADAVMADGAAQVSASTGIGIARSIDDWLISTPNIRDEQQWPFTALLHEIDEINQWLSTQISRSPEYVRLEEALQYLRAEVQRRQLAEPQSQTGTLAEEPTDQQRAAREQAQLADQDLQPGGRLFPERDVTKVVVDVPDRPPTREEIGSLVTRTKADVEAGVLTEEEGQQILSDIHANVIEAPRGAWPTGYSYTIRHEVGYIDKGDTAADLMWRLMEQPNDFFPFRVVNLTDSNAGIRKGHKYDLQHTRFLGDMPNEVVVESTSSTSFTFLTLETHFDGPGARITFTTYEENGIVYLEHNANAPDAGLLNATFAPAGAAFLGWKVQSSRLKTQEKRLLYDPEPIVNPYAPLIDLFRSMDAERQYRRQRRLDEDLGIRHE
jgi:hypothetical protein